jgi:hypothetical protein
VVSRQWILFAVARATDLAVRNLFTLLHTQATPGRISIGRWSTHIRPSARSFRRTSLAAIAVSREPVAV